MPARGGDADAGDSTVIRQRRAGKRRLRRTLAWVLALPIALELLYLVAMNLFLATPLFAAVIDADPLVIDVHYARAWSLYPTHIVARDLRIRGTDSNVEWALELDEVTFDCALRELFAQRFHVTRARGSGISFRLRRKVLAPRATDAYVAGLPDIDGLGPVGMTASEPPYAGMWSDRDWHLWTVRLDDVVAEHVREIWFDWARFQGDALLAGGFRLKPIRDVEVGPFDIVVRRGDATWKGQPALAGLALDVSGHLESFDPRVAEGDDILHRLSLDASGRAEAPGRALASAIPNVRATGSVALDLPSAHIAHGVLGDASRFDATAPALEVALEENRVRSGARVAVRVDRWDLATSRIAGDAQVALSKVDADVGKRDHAVAVDAIDAKLASPAIDVTRPSLAGARWSVRARGGTLRDATALNALLRSPDTAWIEAGTGTFEAELATEGRTRAQGSAAVDLDGALRLPKTRLSGHVALQAKLSDVDLGTLQANLTGSRVALHDIAVQHAAADAAGWYATVRVDEGTIHLLPRPRLDARVFVTARDAAIVWDAGARDAVPGIVADAMTMPHLFVQAQMILAPDLLALTNVEATGGDVALQGLYAARGPKRRAAVVVKKGLLAAGVSLGDDAALHLKLFGLNDWYRDEAARTLQLAADDEGARARPE